LVGKVSQLLSSNLVEVSKHWLLHLVNSVGMHPKLGRKSQQTFVIKLGRRSKQALVITFGKLSRHAFCWETSTIVGE